MLGFSSVLGFVDLKWMRNCLAEALANRDCERVRISVFFIDALYIYHYAAGFAELVLVPFFLSVCPADCRCYGTAFYIYSFFLLIGAYFYAKRGRKLHGVGVRMGMRPIRMCRRPITALPSVRPPTAASHAYEMVQVGDLLGLEEPVAATAPAPG